MAIGSWIDIKEAKKELKAGKIITFPTETVYGIGCIFDNEAAFKHLVSLKKRPPNKPFAMMGDSLDSVLPYLEPSKKALSLMKEFLPGELTVLIKAKEDLPTHVTLGTNIAGLRIPNSPLVRELIKGVGKPLLVTSANISGEKTATKFEDLNPIFIENTFIIKGECVSLLPSTIVDATGDTLKLIREGSLPFSKLKKYWENI